MKTDLNEQLRQVRREEDALDQSIGLNRILLTLIDNQRKTHKWVCILLIISLLCNVAICALFVAYESQFVTTTETITIEQDTEGPGNNVYQSGENAQYVQEGATENGEAENNRGADNQNP